MTSEKVCDYASEDCHWDFGTSRLCRFHYRRIQAGRDPLGPKKVRGRDQKRMEPAPCKEPDCDRMGGLGKAGYCQKHWHEHHRNGSIKLSGEPKTCAITWCEKKTRSKVSGGLCAKHYTLGWKYSKSPIEVIFLLDNYVCLNPGCGSTENLHVDHDHKCCGYGAFSSSKISCGKCVRGLLCKGCNNALGLLQENPERIRGLLDYLKM